MVGHIGQPNHDGQMDGVLPVIKPIDSTAVAQPASFEAMWADHKTGGDQDVTFWRVIAPPGYVAVGDIVVLGYDYPPASITNTYV